MLIELCRSKIKNAFVTETNLHYKGSITISEEVAKRAHLYPAEKVLVVNLNNGNRFETYVIYGEKRKGIIGLNGGTALLGNIGDELLVLSFGIFNEEEISRHKMLILELKDKNQLADDNS